MNPQDTLRIASTIMNERGRNYGDTEFMFDLVANLASLITGREFTAHDVSVVHEATKLARRRVDPTGADHYIDNINYTAISAQFAAKLREAPPAPRFEPVNIEVEMANVVKIIADEKAAEG
jgi:hypothetical protein